MANTEAGAVPPALTAAEWDEVRGRVAWQREAGVDGRAQMEHALSCLADGIRFNGVAAPLPAAMAVANALRDDADPGKLTHADVAALRAMMDALDQEHAWPGGDACIRAPLLAAKLAALLPPREGA